MMTIYLNNKWQYIDSNGICTDNEEINTSAPQCWMLGPFLFLIYINDWVTWSGDSNVTIFADDTTPNKGKKLEKLFDTTDVDSVSSWLVENKLTMNVDENEVMFFGSGNPKKLKKNPRKKSLMEDLS